MSAHTKGPWTFYEDNNYGGTVELGGSGATVTVDRADRFTLDLVISRDEMRANGHLMAAAPDLLAALEELVTRRERVVRKQGGSLDGSDGRYVRARVALAKAKGEKP